MSDYTEGPWDFWNCGGSQIDVAIGPVVGGLAVAQIVTSNAHGIHTAETMARGQANARLLIAAPMMAKALKGMLDVFGDEFGVGESETVDLARSIYAEAMGIPRVADALKGLLDECSKIYDKDLEIFSECRDVLGYGVEKEILKYLGEIIELFGGAAAINKSEAFNFASATFAKAVDLKLYE